MIDLAPQHKIGLTLKNSILPAAGFIGYGKNPYPDLLHLTDFGAIVTNPITLRPNPHQRPPEAKEITGGVIFNTPPRNPGVRRVIQRYQRFWQNNTLPIIAHLPYDDADDLGRTARALDGLGVISGFELGLLPHLSTQEIRSAINAILYNCEVPLMVKLPFAEAKDLADDVIDYGADALTISLNPPGTINLSSSKTFSGAYYGTGTIIYGLPLIAELKARYTDFPLIVSGGIHTQSDVDQYLSAGATAIQLDTIIFIDPLAVQRMLTNSQHDEA